MATVLTPISTYMVFLYGGPDGASGAIATVSLGIAGAYAFLRFYPQTAALPPNSITTHTDGKAIYHVAYREGLLPVMIDLLRNEKPVSFFYREDDHTAYITTSHESVGEGERG